MINLLRKVFLAIGATACMALPAIAQQVPVSNPTTDMNSLIAAAKKEGALTWYTSLAQGDSGKVIKAFEDKYGIKVTVWRSGDDNVLQRIIAESNGKNYKADVAQIQIQNMEALSREKILMPVNSPSYKDLVPGAVPKHHEWAMAQITLFVLAYNTNLIKKADLPKSYKDLLDPKWKGKIGVEATDYDWFDVVTNSLSGNAGIQLFRDIKQRNGFSVRTGHSLTANLVVAGEVPLALNVYQYKAVQLKRSGTPIDWFTLEPKLSFATAIGVMRNAAHPNAALLFHEFMLTDGQKVMASLDMIPSNTTVKSDLNNAGIQFINPDEALDNRDKLEKLFDSVFIKN